MDSISVNTVTLRTNRLFHNFLFFTKAKGEEGSSPPSSVEESIIRERFLTSRENKVNFKPEPYIVNPPVHNSNVLFNVERNSWPKKYHAYF